MFFCRKNRRAREVICTICSKEKKNDPNPMPAVKLYLGEHIRRAHSVALSERRPFFILSGVHGLVESGRHLRHYDQRLEEDKVDDLAALVARQIVWNKIQTIRYLHEPKDSWKPYTRALCKAIELSGIGLIQHALPIAQQEAIMPFTQMLVAPATA